jgi:hypothetical protein
VHQRKKDTLDMANPTNPEAEAGKYIGLGLAIAGTLAIGLFSRFSLRLWNAYRG